MDVIYCREMSWHIFGRLKKGLTKKKKVRKLTKIDFGAGGLRKFRFLPRTEKGKKFAKVKKGRFGREVCENFFRAYLFKSQPVAKNRGCDGKATINGRILEVCELFG